LSSNFFFGILFFYKNGPQYYQEVDQHARCGELENYPCGEIPNRFKVPAIVLASKLTGLSYVILLLYNTITCYTSSVIMKSLTSLWIIVVLIIAGLGWYLFRSPSLITQNGAGEKAATSTDYKNTTYIIEGKQVALINGVAETPAAPGSASMVTTRYFGNELKTDLNGDGREDIAFILTQSTGGSGTFYYAVAALNTPDGYIGSDGYLLGDRVAPQTTTLSSDPKQKYVVVFNYADRAPDEPMTAQPSIGQSAYLKLNPDTMQWAIVLSPAERQSL
jgi:hypothetical protein